MRQLILTSVIILAIAAHIMMRFLLAGTFQPLGLDEPANFTGTSASHVMDASFINHAATEPDGPMVDDMPKQRNQHWQDALTMIGQ